MFKSLSDEEGFGYLHDVQVYTTLDAQPGIDLNADPNAPNLLLIGQQSSATTMVSLET